VRIEWGEERLYRGYKFRLVWKKGGVQCEPGEKRKKLKGGRGRRKIQQCDRVKGENPLKSRGERQLGRGCPRLERMVLEEASCCGKKRGWGISRLGYLNEGGRPQ